MKKGSTGDLHDTPPAPPRAISSFILRPSSLNLTLLSLALGIWFLLVEGGTEVWFRSHETGRAAGIRWRVKPPAPSAGLEQLPVPTATRDELRYTEGGKWAWVENAGTRWQMMYFYWAPGRLWVKSVVRHPPSGCLSAVGWKLIADRGIRDFEIDKLKLGFNAYTFEANGETVNVFYCLWEDGAKVQPMFSGKLTQWDRLRSALAGSRNPGMRVLEIAVWGISEERQAELAVQQQLKKLVVVEQGSAAKVGK
jgi:hypothetical protein